MQGLYQHRKRDRAGKKADETPKRKLAFPNFLLVFVDFGSGIS